MKITANDLQDLHVIDDIIQEPMGGAHRAPSETIQSVGKAIDRALASLENRSADELREQRRERFLRIGRELS